MHIRSKILALLSSGWAWPSDLAWPGIYASRLHSGSSTQLCIHGSSVVPCWWLRNHRRSQEGIPALIHAKKQRRNLTAKMEVGTRSTSLKKQKNKQTKINQHKDLKDFANDSVIVWFFQCHWRLFKTLVMLIAIPTAVPTAVQASISVTRCILYFFRSSL